MDHELEKPKYRNWVKGGLAYKYLKDGIEGFAEEVVQQEHTRILQDVKNTTGLTCNQCSLQGLKPIHKKEREHVTGKDICPKGQINCNCLYANKKKCPNKICDAIYEEILEAHGSTSNWKNTDIHKWCSYPWEVAKCFISAPGYKDKSTSSEIDVSGLLHIFINNINFNARLSCTIAAGSDRLGNALNMRNTIFHSPKLELGDKELSDCIDNIIAILEDEKELKARHDAQQAVIKLKRLKENKNIVTTHNEVEVCKAAMTFITDKAEELKQTIQDIKDEIQTKHTEALNESDDKIQKALNDALEKLDDHSDSKLQMMKQTIDLLKERINQVEKDNIDMKQEFFLVKQRLKEIESNIDRVDAARVVRQEQLKYVNQKLVLQMNLVELYQRHTVKTKISLFNNRNKDVNIAEVYTEPNMAIEDEAEPAPGEEAVTYATIYTEPRPLDGNSDSRENAIRPNKSNLRTINRYRDIFKTDNVNNKKIYIVGDVGTGKSSLCKMMIHNWCQVITDQSKSLSDENVEEMKKFDFLFFISLQRVSGYSCDIIEMIKVLYDNVFTDGFLNKILEKESECCLILADGLDEWSPPKDKPLLHQVSHGLPNGEGILNATMITFSRPSAKGFLNMKSSECDQRIKLQGVNASKLDEFIRKYMTKISPNEYVGNDFLCQIDDSPLQHVEKTPLFLQQLLCVYSKKYEIGKSVSDIYCNLLNIMFFWFEKEERENPAENICILENLEHMELPKVFLKYERCDRNKKYIYLLGKIAFEALIENDISGKFARSKLLKCGLKTIHLDTLVKLGFLVENNFVDQHYENTYLSFVHTSYIEFLAAVYISSHDCPSQTQRLELILEKLFVKFKTAADILHLSNFLKLVCELSPFVIETISYFISRNVEDDESMIKYRNDLHKCGPWIRLRGTKAEQIQTLITNCLSESVKHSNHAVSICDIVINEEFEKSFLKNVVPNNVLSIRFTNYFYEYSGYESIDLSRCHKLQSIQLPIALCTLEYGVHSKNLRHIYLSGQGYTSHEICKHLESSFIQALNLQYIKLEHFTCSRADCDGHIVDLSKQNDLRSIYLEKFLCRFRSSENCKYLEDMYINFAEQWHTARVTEHEICEKISSSVSQALSLKRLTLKRFRCNRGYNCIHTIDLYNHDKIQDIDVDHFVCTLGCAKSLESFSILMKEYGQVKHNICEQLSSSLTQAVSLKQLTLKDIICECKCRKGHTVDLAEHEKLQKVYIENVSITFRSSVKTKLLETIEMRGGGYGREKGVQHEICENLLSWLSEAVSLKQIVLRDIKCNSANCDGHSYDLSKLDQLKTIYLENATNDFIPLAINENTENVYILETGNEEGGVKHRACEKISRVLSQAGSLKVLRLTGIPCNNLDCKAHFIDMSKSDQLQSIYLEKVLNTYGTAINSKVLETVIILDTNNVKHEICEQLSTGLSQSVFLKKLDLKSISCSHADCEGHTIDLTKHYQLKNVLFTNRILSTFVVLFNSKSLEKLDISRHDTDVKVKHEVCEQLASSITQSVSLEDLSLQCITCDSEHCEGHTIDLSKHYQLKNVRFSSDILSTFRVLFNSKSLENLDNSFCHYTNFKVKHEVCEQLASSITQSVSLKNLTLNSITCDSEHCKCHAIDLSGHNQLRTLTLLSCCFFVSGINKSSLQEIEISSFPDVLEECASSQLTNLSINYNYCDSEIWQILLYTKKMNSAIKTLQHLQRLTLKHLDFDENALVVAPGMRNLREIDLFEVKISLKTWKIFVDSLLTLKQPVKVKTFDLFIKLEEPVVRTIFFLFPSMIQSYKKKNDAKQYVKQMSEKMEVVEDEEYIFTFKKV